MLTHLWTRERPFLVVLSLGLLVRVLLQFAFPPAFVYSDGPAYLDMVDHLTPSPDRPVAYGALLGALALVSRSVALVAVTQHLLGLFTGTLMYVTLRRWGVSPLVAALAIVPVMLDAMQLILEHSPLSDVTFDLLVLGGIAALGWRRPLRPGYAVLGGLLLGLATLVRVVGEPTVVAAALFCVAVGAGTRWWRRGLLAALMCVSFAVPVIGYATWFHAEHGRWALTEVGGRALYMRTTGFVDCARLQVPAAQRQLCPAEALGHRQDPTYYGWHAPAPALLDVPPGMIRDQVLKQFAMRAIRAQPGAYLSIVARDFGMNFYPVRLDWFEYDTAYKWRIAHYIDYQPTPTWTEPAFAAHGGEQPFTRHPLGDVLAVYGSVAFLPGPVLFALTLLALVGFAARRPADIPSRRPEIFLCAAIGIGLMLVPDVTAEFVWRYQLPALMLVPMAAAVAWTRLHVGQQPQRGTDATPSTD